MALFLALPALRLRGPYFGLTTLVAVLMLQNYIVVDASLTGGEIGLTVPDVITISDTKNYEIALWFMAISAAILFSLSRSPVGLILQASGQDAVQAGALGFNVTKHKLTAFIISAFFSGLAGALLVFYLGSASVGTFVDITVGVQVIIAAVLGGRRTILGAVLGAVFIIAMSEALRPIGDLANFTVFAAMALVVVLFFPWRDLWPAHPFEGERVGMAETAHLDGFRPYQALRRSRRRERYGAQCAGWPNPWPDRPERLGQIDRRVKLIMGIERPDAGSVRIDGVEVAGWPSHRIARLGAGMVFSSTHGHFIARPCWRTSSLRSFPTS